jgi:DNA-binding transcriptional LysR family regulator
VTRPRSLHSSPSAGSDRLLSGSYWGELRVFLEVAKAKSFNNAAKQLKLTHPTIARRVRDLEKQMRVQLLVSTERGIKLTPRGEELAKALSNFDQSLYAIAAGVEEDTPNAEATVRVSLTNGTNAIFVAPNLQAFSRSNPHIHVHTKSIVSLNDLRQNQTDMMVAYVTPEDRPDLFVERLGTIHFRPLASKTYVSEYGLPTEANLKHHKFIQSYLYESNPDLWGDWNDLVRKGTVSHYCDDTLVYALMIRWDLGIGLTPTYVSVHREGVPVDLNVLISLPLYGIALRERLRSRPVRLVFDWLCDIFSERNVWFPSEFKAEEMPSKFDVLTRLFG